MAHQTESIHYSITKNRTQYSCVDYQFNSKEESEEMKQRYREAKLGGATTGEQKNASDRIYRIILMKRRMKAKALKALK